MLAQAIFNKAATYLLKQQRKSTGPRGYCAYRGENQDCCAIGALIPDGFYDPAMDSNPDGGDTGVGYVLESFPHLTQMLLPEDLSTASGLAFLRQIQSVHDDFEPHEWFEHFCRCADDWGLNTDALKEFA